MAKSMIGILFSGGLESTALLEYFQNTHKHITLIYIKCGYRWEKAEIFHCNKIVDYYRRRNRDKSIDFVVLDLADTFRMSHRKNIRSSKENILPIRNLFMLVNASMYLLSQDINILIAGIQDNPDYPDTGSVYIDKITNLIRLGAKRESFKILLPFHKMTKSEIIDKCGKNIPLKYIFSCTEPNGNNACRKCYKCNNFEEAIRKYSLKKV